MAATEELRKFRIDKAKNRILTLLNSGKSIRDILKDVDEGVEPEQQMAHYLRVSGEYGKAFMGDAETFRDGVKKAYSNAEEKYKHTFGSENDFLDRLLNDGFSAELWITQKGREKALAYIGQKKKEAREYVLRLFQKANELLDNVEIGNIIETELVKRNAAYKKNALLHKPSAIVLKSDRYNYKEHLGKFDDEINALYEKLETREIPEVETKEIPKGNILADANDRDYLLSPITEKLRDLRTAVPVVVALARESYDLFNKLCGRYETTNFKIGNGILRGKYELADGKLPGDREGRFTAPAETTGP